MEDLLKMYRVRAGVVTELAKSNVGLAGLAMRFRLAVQQLLPGEIPKFNCCLSEDDLIVLILSWVYVPAELKADPRASVMLSLESEIKEHLLIQPLGV